jgi:hypothetical protein
VSIWTKTGCRAPPGLKACSTTDCRPPNLHGVNRNRTSVSNERLRTSTEPPKTKCFGGLVVPAFSDFCENCHQADFELAAIRNRDRS